MALNNSCNNGLRNASRYVVAPTFALGEYTTIQSAIDQAVADGADAANPAIVWVSAGIYTEDLALVPFVSLAGAVDGSVNAVQVVGNSVYTDNTGAGTNEFSITNMSFVSNNTSPAISFQGSGTSNMHLQSLDASATATSGTALECTGANFSINVTISTLEASSGAKCMNVSAGNVFMFAGVHSSFVDTASTISGTAVVRLFSCVANDAFVLTDSSSLYLMQCFVTSGNLTCVDVGVNCALISYTSIMLSDATSNYFVTGTGAYFYTQVVAVNDAKLIDPGLNILPQNSLSGNISFDGGNTFLSTKGDMWASDGALPGVLGAGTDGQVLTADSAQTLGVKWANNAAGALSINTQVFTSSGTYTPSANLVYAVVECVGGGGGGGGAVTGANQSSGGGGGAGGYSRKSISSATIGASQSITIGAAGTAGSAGNNAGGSGGTTSFGSIFSATGGAGGGGGTDSGGGITNGGGGGAGGSGSSGDFNTTGSPGGWGSNINVPAVGTFVSSGAGGASFFGGNANTIIVAGTGQTAGSNATSYGGGGSGGATDAGSSVAGGAGASGVCIVTEYIFS